VAGIYLLLGMVVLRRRRGVRAAPVRQADVTGWLRPLCGPRFEFACILAASLAGLTSPGAVLFYADQAEAGALAIIDDAQRAVVFLQRGRAGAGRRHPDQAVTRPTG
jgi:hypothetical protein